MKNDANLLIKNLVGKRAVALLFQVLGLAVVVFPTKSANALVVPVYHLEFQADVVVKGQIVDPGGLPLPGVTIRIQGTSVGTVSDSDGNYSISAPVNSVLTFSFIGFKSQTVEVGNQNIINVTMEEDLASLDEVIVTSFGV